MLGGAEAHGTASGTSAAGGLGDADVERAGRHGRNAERFVEGVHFVKLEGSDLRQFKAALPVYLSVSPNTRNLLLWTEKGAARHAKMLSTDKAWDVFEQLEETYFAISDLAKTIGYEGNIPALIEDISDAVMNRMGGMVKAAIRAEVSRRFKAFKNDPVTALDGREVRFNGVGLREMRAHSADIRTMLLTNKALSNSLKLRKSKQRQSREIAELVDSLHDNVRVTIDHLAERGVIALPALQVKPTAGLSGN